MGEGDGLAKRAWADFPNSCAKRPFHRPPERQNRLAAIIGSARAA
jgi:hypothetical protein